MSKELGTLFGTTRDGVGEAAHHRPEIAAVGLVLLQGVVAQHHVLNLSGQGSGDVLDQEVQLLCSSYTPAGQDSIPFGRVEPVEGTPMDLRRPTPIGARFFHPDYNRWSRSCTESADADAPGRGLYRQRGVSAQRYPYPRA